MALLGRGPESNFRLNVSFREVVRCIAMVLFSFLPLDPLLSYLFTGQLEIFKVFRLGDYVPWAMALLVIDQTVALLSPLGLPARVQPIPLLDEQ